jgi:hypothetical protein
MGPYSIAEYPIVSAAFLCLSVRPLLVPPDPSTQILMTRARPTAYKAEELDLMPNFRRGLTAIAHHRSTRADRYPTATFGIRVPLQLLAARLSTHPAQSRHVMNVGQVSSHQGTLKPIQVPLGLHPCAFIDIYENVLVPEFLVEAERCGSPFLDICELVP